MFKATELLGRMLQAGMSRSAAGRLRHALDAQGLGPRQDDPEVGGAFAGLAETAPDFLPADRSRQVGAGSGALTGGVSGGALAFLSGLARSALGQPHPAPGTGQAAQTPPQGAPDRDEPEQSAILILAAMINAAKADGQVDQEELQRIVGKLRDTGATPEAVDFVMTELSKPPDLDGLLRRVPSEQVAVQLYAASLLAIDVDTEAERRYLRRLAHGLGLGAGVVRRVHQYFGMGHT